MQASLRKLLVLALVPQVLRALRCAHLPPGPFVRLPGFVPLQPSMQRMIEFLLRGWLLHAHCGCPQTVVEKPLELRQ